MSWRGILSVLLFWLIVAAILVIVSLVVASGKVAVIMFATMLWIVAAVKVSVDIYKDFK